MQRSNSRKTCGDSKPRRGPDTHEVPAASALDKDSKHAAGCSQDQSGTNVTNEPASKTWDTPPLNFPARLMQILQLEDPPDGIYWLPDGKRFAIHIEMIEDVLVTYFQGAKWLSFTRTLNKWGFRKALGVDLPAKVVAYYNPHFQKSSPNSVTQIINHSRPANRKRKADKADEHEQNFLPFISEPRKANSSSSSGSRPHRSLHSASNLEMHAPTMVSSATGSDATAVAALGFRSKKGSNLLSTIPSYALPRSDDSLRSEYSFLERMMTPNSVGLRGQLGDLADLAHPWGIQQQQQNQATLRSEFLLQQHLEATPDAGNIHATSAAAAIEHRLLLLQSQLASRQQLQQQSQFPHLLGHVQQHRQLSQQRLSPSLNFDALAMTRIEQLHQQQRLARSYGDLLRGGEAVGDYQAEGTECDDAQPKKED